VLGGFTYAETSWPQALADRIAAHTRAFAALGSVTKLWSRTTQEPVLAKAEIAGIKACLTDCRSIGATPRWRRITILRPCRRSRAGRATPPLQFSRRPATSEKFGIVQNGQKQLFNCITGRYRRDFVITLGRVIHLTITPNVRQLRVPISVNTWHSKRQRALSGY
jgi:hypothetical protein